jgi:hypothetical protein
MTTDFADDLIENIEPLSLVKTLDTNAKVKNRADLVVFRGFTAEA